jgi:hypothetical protein
MPNPFAIAAEHIIKRQNGHAAPILPRRRHRSSVWRDGPEATSTEYGTPQRGCAIGLTPGGTWQSIVSRVRSMRGFAEMPRSVVRS